MSDLNKTVEGIQLPPIPDKGEDFGLADLRAGDMPLDTPDQWAVEVRPIGEFIQFGPFVGPGQAAEWAKRCLDPKTWRLRKIMPPPGE